jgi:DTW domain-containing protein YfiP
MSHAVARLRAVRMARLDKPFIARGSRVPRCPGCRVMFSHCLCALRPQVPTQAGMCLIMCDIEPLKPSKSPYLNHLPVLSLQPEQLSRYRLRRSTRDDHLCTSEVASLCLALAGEARAADTLETYLDVFTHHYLNAKQSVPPDLEDAAHQRLRALGNARG